MKTFDEVFNQFPLQVILVVVYVSWMSRWQTPRGCRKESMWLCQVRELTAFYCLQNMERPVVASLMHNVPLRCVLNL